MRHGTLVLAFFAMASAALAPAWSAGLPLANRDSDKPVTITADSQDFDIKAKTVIYKGDVKAVQGEIRLRADMMKADQVANKIYVSGKVVVDSPTSGTATGDNAIYDLTSKLVTLSGHVVLNKTGQATMRGSLLSVNMLTGKAQLTAQPVVGGGDQAAAPGLPGGRVQGVFTPKPAQDSKPAGGN
jgi:lipopolysaccharide export system protein LptA